MPKGVEPWCERLKIDGSARSWGRETCSQAIAHCARGTPRVQPNWEIEGMTLDGLLPRGTDVSEQNLTEVAIGQGKLVSEGSVARVFGAPAPQGRTGRESVISVRQRWPERYLLLLRL